MLRRYCIDCIRWPRPQYMRPGLFSCLVGECVGRTVLECDGGDAAIVHDDVVYDLLEEAVRDGGVNGSDVLLVVDVAVFDQLVRHDVVRPKCRSCGLEIGYHAAHTSDRAAITRLARDCRVVDAIYAVNDVRRRVGTLKTED